MSRAIVLHVLAASAALALMLPGPALSEDMIAFTANQGFLSRIYALDMNGAVMHCHEYSNYRFVGMETVDGELYIAEAFAPRVYKVNPVTGSLQVFIDDWSLYYFYDVAFDGTYFYVDEWSLNRYDINGNYAGSAGFSEYVLGCAWDGEYFWTLDDMDLIKCWDLSGWPSVTPVPDRNFVPPSAGCRGLFFDGEYFWSAERGDSPGWIFQFDHTGTVMQQLPEPAYSGWGAAWIRDDASGVEGGASDLVFGITGSSPNPSASATVISFFLPVAVRVELSVHDVRGTLVETLHDGHTGAGHHLVEWQPEPHLPGGVYWAMLRMGGQVSSRKMVILK